MVNAEHRALIMFTATAAPEAPVNIVKKRAMSWNTGFPGGWPTSSLYDDAINSPQSQKEADGSIVEMYVNEAITSTATEVTRFHNLNCLLSILNSFLFFCPKFGQIKLQIYDKILYLCKNCA